MHEPVFDHVLAPGEFVETIADKFLDAPAASDETFQVTVVEEAADTELLVAKPSRTTTRRKSPPERREGEEIFTAGI